MRTKQDLKDYTDADRVDRIRGVKKQWLTGNQAVAALLHHRPPPCTPCLLVRPTIFNPVWITRRVSRIK